MIFDENKPFKQKIMLKKTCKFMFFFCLMHLLDRENRFKDVLKIFKAPFKEACAGVFVVDMFEICKILKVIFKGILNAA